MSLLRRCSTALGLAVLLILLTVGGCGGDSDGCGNTTGTARSVRLCSDANASTNARVISTLPTGQLLIADVQNIIAQAVVQAQHDGTNVVIAITDREGNVLGVYDMNGAPPGSADDALGLFSPPTPQDIAIQKARTAAYLSSDQNAFSSRTALQITGKHFPPNIDNAGPGPLFGLPMSSLPCGDVQKNGSGLTGALGGIPLYKSNAIAGGIGVDGARKADATENQQEDEVIALAGTRRGYGAGGSITANNLLVNGFRFDWIGDRLPDAIPFTPFASLPPGSGNEDANFPMTDGSPPPTEIMEAGVPGEWRVSPHDSTASNLTAADVIKMVDQSLNQEKITRAAIRLPVGIPSRMQVGVTDIQGNVLGLFRTNDATMFSMDIVIQKGRTVTSFSDPNQPLGIQLRDDLRISRSARVAVTSRTIEFLAQPFYPPGITQSAPGPLFCYDFNSPHKGLLFCLQQQLYNLHPGPGCLPNGNGITLFPGSTPLYKSGVLVGGLGISGDGVDQDDFVTNAGAKGYLPANAIRATRIKFRGSFLPFFKFPRHPELGN
jgi:uncharacterized protein GlcG (DUF336 family)